jgi:hypothetical protein
LDERFIRLALLLFTVGACFVRSLWRAPAHAQLQVYASLESLNSNTKEKIMHYLLRKWNKNGRYI